jgi:hypothetical protein
VVAALNLVALPFNWIETPKPDLAIGITGGMLIGGSVLVLVWSMGRRPLRAVAAVVGLMLLVNHLFYAILMPWLSPYRSARRFMTAATQIIEAGPPEPAVAVIRYRSAFRYYGEFPLVEMKSPEDVTRFFEQHHHGWLITREKDLEKALRRLPLEMEEHLRMRVGRGKVYLLVTRKPPPDG